MFRTPLPLDRDGHTRMPLAGLTSARPELEFWYESCQVSTSALDRLVRRHTLGGADRPALEQRQLNGMLKGFVDLVFEHQGRYYLLDYKSNHLGEDDSAYTPQALGQTILDKRYDLQYCLYLLALHRLLQGPVAGLRLRPPPGRRRVPVPARLPGTDRRHLHRQAPP